MKTVIALLLSLLSLAATAQNGGQYFENNVIKIQYLGFVDGAHIFKICNKQSCTARIRTRVDQDPVTDIQVAANDCVQASVIKPIGPNLLFRAKSETSCISNPDMGWLEINTALVTLPLIESNSVIVVRGPNEFRASVSNGVYRSSYTNRDYLERITVYNIIGQVKYKTTTLVKRRKTINLDKYLQTGLNFIDILIETNKPEHITIKYIK